MPWPTTHGLRILRHREADLVRRSIGSIAESIVAERDGKSEQWQLSIHWFDQWEDTQRLWLLDQISNALLGDAQLEPAAMYDATVDAVFVRVMHQIDLELDQGGLGESELFWRDLIWNCYVDQISTAPEISLESGTAVEWHRMVTRIADGILGVRLYQRAEGFRDSDYKETQSFLRGRGLPDSYLGSIPPVIGQEEANALLDRIAKRLDG